jgi:hypothetical protein
MAIRAGSITAFHLFDIADEIDLAAVPRLLQASASHARLAPKAYTPAYLQYQVAPLVIDAETLDVPEVDGCRVRIKVFDYGIVSLAFTRPLAGPWEEFAAAGARMARLEDSALDLCRIVAGRLEPALVTGHRPDLSEDYVVFAVTELSERLTADDLLARHGDTIAALLRAEREPLSLQERDEVLRHHISYLADDLVIPTWSNAFVYDTEAGARAALEIFEFANSQLLEFRYYDALLDSELERIYDSLGRPRWHDWLGGRRMTREADELHALFIEVTELTDKTENALKMVGDVYAARLYALVAARLGLAGWKQNVEDKLDTLDDIYRFTVDQTQMSRANLLELTIVLILVLELLLVFLGIMK